MSQPEVQHSSGNSRVKQWIGIALSVLTLLLVIGYLFMAENSIDVEQTTEAKPLQPVSIEEIYKAPETIKITAFAQVRPRWSVALRSAVSGKIVEVMDSALAGEEVDSDTNLISIENSAYLAEVAAAEYALKESQLALSKAKKATNIARKQFKREQKKAPNDLALLIPQLHIAESAVKAAQTRLTAAQQQLSNTLIKAPFSGFITQRFVSPGQSVSPGDLILKLTDNQTFELTVKLGRQDWLLLNQPIQGSQADVLNQDGKLIAQAKVRQGGGFLDEASRQYQIFLEIESNENQSLLSGDFVKVVLPGITIKQALNIPESAYTPEGYIWSVNNDDRLQRISPRVLYRYENRIVIESPNDTVKWRIATSPLESFLPGQQITPLDEKD